MHSRVVETFRFIRFFFVYFCFRCQLYVLDILGFICYSILVDLPGETLSLNWPIVCWVGCETPLIYIKLFGVLKLVSLTNLQIAATICFVRLHSDDDFSQCRVDRRDTNDQQCQAQQCRRSSANEVMSASWLVICLNFLDWLCISHHYVLLSVVFWRLLWLGYCCHCCTLYTLCSVMSLSFSWDGDDEQKCVFCCHRSSSLELHILEISQDTRLTVEKWKIEVLKFA